MKIAQNYGTKNRVHKVFTFDFRKEFLVAHSPKAIFVEYLVYGQFLKNILTFMIKTWPLNDPNDLKFDLKC